MRIHALQLFGVKARRRTADRLQREPFYGLGAADNLVVAMSPAKAEQIILQRFGEDAQLVAIGLYPQCPMALGQLCPVGSMDQRDVRIDRLRPAHGADELKLAERSEEHTSELQSLMRISYAVFCLKKKKQKATTNEQDKW